MYKIVEFTPDNEVVRERHYTNWVDAWADMHAILQGAPSGNAVDVWAGNDLLETVRKAS